MPRRPHATLSYLQAPVDEILGKESHVRILRVLTEYEHPIPPVELAHATRLDLSGVLRALQSLADTGIVSSIGVGRGRVFHFNSAHYFAPVLQHLFDAERQRRQDLLDELQRAVQSLSPTPRSAWIEGAHAIGQDTTRDPLRVGALVHARDRHVTSERLVERLRDIERRFGITIDLVLRTKADLGTLTQEQIDTLGQVIPLHGVPPIHLLNANPSSPTSSNVEHNRQPGSRHAPETDAEKTHAPEGGGPRTHADLDAASRQVAEKVARELQRDPRVVERARRWIAHRLPKASEAERHELREWEHILTMPPHRISAFLLDPGERAIRLRQTSPFLADPHSRWT